MGIIELTEEDLTERAYRITFESDASRGPKLIAIVARRFSISPGDMLAQNRDQHLCDARRALYLELRSLGWSWKRIGRLVKRDHTTIMASAKQNRRKHPRFPQGKQDPQEDDGS